MGYYDLPVDPERKKADLEEIQRRSEKIAQPAPEPMPVNAQRVRDGYGRSGIDFDERFPPSLQTKLHDPPPRTAGGDVPEVDGRSEADKLRDPAYLLRCVNHLQAGLSLLDERLHKLETEGSEAQGKRIAYLEDIIKRQFGEALYVDKPTWR